MEEDTNDQQAERERRETPRIYVASLSDYNAGRLHGTWLDADQADEDLAAGVEAMLRASPTPGAEEYAIHDYEGFGPLRIAEDHPLSVVGQIARGIVEHGPAYAHWVNLHRDEDHEAFGRFEEAYRGDYESTEDYAQELIDDLGYERIIDDAVPEFLRPYVSIDVAAFARDLDLSGDIYVCDHDQGVYIFEGNV